MDAPPSRRRFQFSLRTLMIGVAAIALFLPQFPLLEWEPPIYRHALRIGDTIYSPTGGPLRSGYYFVPERVWRVAAAEVVIASGWLLLKWLRRRRTCTQS